MDLGNSIQPPGQKDFEAPSSWVLATPAKTDGDRNNSLATSDSMGSQIHISSELESIIPPGELKGTDKFFQGSECHNADSHAQALRIPPEGCTQIPLGNVAAFRCTSTAVEGSQQQSHSFHLMMSNGKVELNPHIFSNNSQNGIAFPHLQNCDIYHLSQITKSTIANENTLNQLAPITPDKCKRSGDVRTNQVNMHNKHGSISAGKGPIQICFGQGVPEPANLTYMEFSVQLRNQEQLKGIKLQNTDLNRNNSCPMVPVTPGNCQTLQNALLQKAKDLAGGKGTEENEQMVNDIGLTGKKPTEICLDQGALQQADLPSSGLSLQEQNLEQVVEESQVVELDRTPPQKARKRKHRPKVIIEGKPARKPRQVTPKTAGTPEKLSVKRKYIRKNDASSSETPSVKRKYMRKKDACFSETPSSVIEGTTEPARRSLRKSVKRTLNFDAEEGQAKDETQASTSSKPDPESQDNGLDVKSTLDVSVEEAEDPSAKIATDHSVNQFPDRHAKLQENLPPAPHPSRRRTLRENLKASARKRGREGDQSNHVNVKIQSCSDVIIPPGLQATCQSNPIRKYKESKREYNHTVNNTGLFHVNVVLGNFTPRKTCNDINRVGEYHYSIGNQVHYLPEIWKKRRTDNRQKKFIYASSSVTTCFTRDGEHLSDLYKGVFSFADAQRFLSTEKLRSREHMLRFDQMEEKIKQPSSAPTQDCELVFRTTNMCSKQLPTTPKTPSLYEQRQRFARTEVLVQGMPVKVPRRRRTKKDSKRCNSHETHADPVDIIIHKFRCLNIHGISKEITPQDLQKDKALVLYSGGGAMVSLEGLLDSLRKRRPRAKVDLDSETKRVWMLLMGKDGGNCPEGADLDKEKWWDEERKVFRGRADSFIARMHLVQGDRRFSQWKGSVIDSVIGVFLTQNVSDHLSSSAFMNLAARFPCHSKGDNMKSKIANQNKSKENQVESVVESQDHIQQQERMSNQIEAGQGSVVIHEAQLVKEKESAKDNVSLARIMGTSNVSCSKGSTTVDNKVGTSSALTSTSSVEDEDMGSLEGVLSSQNSAVSSQNSTESPVQAADRIGLSSESNSEVEDLINGNGWNRLDGPTSFTELLQMAGTSMHPELYSWGSGRVASDGTLKSLIDVSECDRVEKTNLGMDHSQKHNDVGPSMVKPCSHLCAEQQDFTRVSCGPSMTSNIFIHSESGNAATGVGKGSQSSLSLTSSAATSKSDITQLCTIGDPLEKNTTEDIGEENLVLTDSCTKIRIHHDQPLPCSGVEASLEKLSCNHNHLLSKSAESTNMCLMLSDGYPAKLQKNDRGMDLQVEGTEGEIEVSAQTPRSYRLHESHSDTAHCPHTQEISSSLEKEESMPQRVIQLNSKNGKVHSETVKDAVRQNRRKVERKKNTFDWDSLRKQACSSGIKKERSSDTMDSIDWEAVRNADVSEISHSIRERGMNNVLAERIKDFLNRMVREHGSIDLEWLRDIPPDKAKEYLLSIWGLGLKSVECVRLLTLHHLAFPVDTNVGRICVRLGWVPLQPLPESLQLHLLEMYPILETIQKYLWPRLCKLDQRTLYELHYQMITFGKVFCTKSKPNCNACPMRGECKHFASAFASARLALPGPEEKSLVSSTIPTNSGQNPNPIINGMALSQLHENLQPVASQLSLPQLEGNPVSQGPVVNNCEPIIEEPATPEPGNVEVSESAFEDAFYEDPDEIPTIKLNTEQFTQNLQDILQGNNMELLDGDMSKALVALTPEATSIPQPKLKNVSRLRTEHQVYVLPDSHPLLEGLDQREHDDPCPYLLAIWTPGETAQSMESSEMSCNSQETGKLCDRTTCFSCNSIREAQAQKVRGTLLIPCRTVMRGSFPLNGTYFQVNEVFADHCSSLSPIDVPREWIWNLPRRSVYFGTSIPTIFRGLTTEGIQHCFWRGFVCVRGFDQKTRAPRPLLARLHFPASKVPRKRRTATKEE